MKLVNLGETNNPSFPIFWLGSRASLLGVLIPTKSQDWLSNILAQRLAEAILARQAQCFGRFLLGAW